MTFLTLQQQEILKKEIQVIKEDKDFAERMDRALKTFYGFYQPTCKTKEDMRECENTNR